MSAVAMVLSVASSGLARVGVTTSAAHRGNPPATTATVTSGPASDGEGGSTALTIGIILAAVALLGGGAFALGRIRKTRQ